MMLVEEGKVSLDVGVREYLPEVPEKWDSVTVRNLLTHTSGIFNYTNVVPFVALGKRDYTQDQIVRMVSDLKLNFAPGIKFEYSNTNYYLLGMMVERISGEAYWSFMENRIFRPLGMTHTRNGDPKTVIENRAAGYFWNGKTWLNMAPLTSTAGWAAGSLVSTVEDMAKWDAALYTEMLLKSETLKQIFTPAKLKNGKDAHGLRLRLGERGEERAPARRTQRRHSRLLFQHFALSEGQLDGGRPHEFGGVRRRSGSH